MNQEKYTCQNCKKEFVIGPEDFAFYEKIKVPSPTWCPECRLIRRMTFRNERSLYRRKCALCGKNILAIYSTDKPFTIYCSECWWSDKWNPIEYGRDYDFSKSFFLQFRELLERIPLIALSVTNLVNCDYCNVSANDKECYLISGSEANERVMFANRVSYNKDSLDIHIGDHNELCYEIINCHQCYRVFFARNCYQCIDSTFLSHCTNCNNCFGCTNLRNKSYHFFNQPYTKDEYQKKIKELNLGSFDIFSQFCQKYKDSSSKQICRFANIVKSVDTTGDNVQHAKNCKFCFDILGNPSAEECKFFVWGGFNCKDSYDVGPGVGVNAERFYETLDAERGNRLNFASVVYDSYQVDYSINCHNSNNLFGCYGLRHKQYCILNKQYTKEEYERLVPKIIEHMNKMPYIDKKGRVYKYGEFFPPELSPFCYNETIAQEYFPLTKEQALEQGYKWKDPEERNIKSDIKTEELPDHIKDVKDDILGKVIQCAHAKLKEDGSLEATCNEQCTTAFKIIPQELEFYRKMNLPLPRLCPNCRHYQRIKQRNPLKLWKRKCMCGGQASVNGVYKNTIKHFHGNNPCPNEFLTTYAPDRPEIVYCEKCYLQEVV